MSKKNLTPNQRKRCQALKADGVPCQARPLQGEAFCFWHDPTKSQARKDAGRTGGLQGRRRTLPADIGDFSVDSAASVVELLSRTVNQTLRGEVDPKVANAVGYLSGVILRAREQGDIEERIARIEEALAAQNGGTK